MSTEVSSPPEDISFVSDNSSSISQQHSPTEEFYLNAIEGRLSRRRFMRRISTIRNLLSSHTLDVEELQHIWYSVIGDEDTCDLNGFMAVNIAVEEYLLYHSNSPQHNHVIIIRASDIAACIGNYYSLYPL